eukprot:GHVO01063545.1.p1 GENE.GHVO01063545.1~~GHVO01063545.1.p1  ORF type:complete len:117 (-),score=17.00 GHVO01063545.1:1285-1635(-)
MVRLRNASIDWVKGQRYTVYKKTSVLMCALEALNDHGDDDHVNGAWKKEVLNTHMPDIKEAWKISELWRQYGVCTALDVEISNKTASFGSVRYSYARGVYRGVDEDDQCPQGSRPD